MDEARFGGAFLWQVGRLLGLSEEEVIARAELLGADFLPSRGWFERPAVDALTAEVTAAKSLHEARDLIVAAFKKARDAEKPDWLTMTVPVLKNRLLDLTQKKFTETDFGCASIWSFVTKFPDLLTLEGAWRTERVTIRVDAVPGAASGSEGESDVASGRIRKDLWQAVFDYTSGETFVWDEVRGRARPKGRAEASDSPVIPTVDAGKLRELRREFVGLQVGGGGVDLEKLREWADKPSAGSGALPRLYRGLWNAHLKSHAAEILRSFFVTHHLEVPPDLFQDDDLPRADVERARELAHRYIDSMTADELSRLTIELAVIQRVAVRPDRR